MKYQQKLPHNFLGIEKNPSKPTAKFSILPIPYDGTTSYKGGAYEGPWAIIEASRFVELYDMEFNKEITDEVLIETMPELLPSTDGPKAVLDDVERAVSSILKNNHYPIGLGGEHSVTLGIVNALIKKIGKFSILQIDAHPDLRNDYEGSRYSHACTMRRVWELGCDVVSVGIRSVSKEDIAYINRKKAHVYYGNNFDIKNILKVLGPKVYISIDLDGFDPAYVPAVGTPEPGGLKWEQVTDLIKQVVVNKKVVGADVVELAPIPGSISSDFFAAKLVYKIIAYISQLNHH